MPKMPPAAIHRWVLYILLAMIPAGGCTNYNQKVDHLVDTYRQGRFEEAAAEIVEISKDEEASKDELVILLEQGAVLRAANRLAESNAALERAYQICKTFDEKAKIRLSKEAYAALVNQASTPYEGYGYDRIMICVYKALNYLELGSVDDARIEVNRVREAQQDCAERYADKIDNDRAAARDQGYDVDRTMQDPKLQQMLSSNYADLPDLRGEAVYLNPYAEYVQMLFHLYAEDRLSRENGRVAARNLRGMVDGPVRRYLDADLVQAEQIARSQAAEPTTYILLETGVAPRRDQIRIDLPIFLLNLGRHDTFVDYIGVAFPTLKTQGGYDSGLRIHTSAGNFATLPVADMDRIIGQEFKNELPGVITRTIISAALKAGISYALARGTKDNDTANALVRIGSLIYQAATNEADRRTWRTLPRQMQIARFATPRDRNLLLEFDGAPPRNISLAPGTINVIWIRQTGPQCVTPAVRQLVLK